MAGNVITSDDTSNKNSTIGTNGNSFYHQPTPTLHLPTPSSAALVHTNTDQEVNVVTAIGNNINSQHESANNRNHLRPSVVAMVHSSDPPPLSLSSSLNQNTSVPGRVNYRSSDPYSVAPMAPLAMLPRSQMYPMHPMNLFSGTLQPAHSARSHTMPLLMNSLSSNPGHLHSFILQRGPMITSGHEVPQNILEAKCSPLYARNVKSHPFTCYHEVPNQACNSYSIEPPVNGHSVGTNADSSTVTTFSMSSSYKATSYSSTISNGNCIDRNCGGTRPLTSPIARGQLQPPAVVCPGDNQLPSSPFIEATTGSLTTIATTTSSSRNDLPGHRHPQPLARKSKSVQLATKNQASNSLNTVQYLPPQCKCHNCHDRQGDTDAINCHLPRNTPTDPIVTLGSNKSSLSESMVIQLTPTATVSMSKQATTTDAASVQVQSDKANINDSQDVKDKKDRGTRSVQEKVASLTASTDKKVTSNRTSPCKEKAAPNDRKDQATAKRRNRHTFSPKQISMLENIFDLNTHYPDTCTLVSLSKKLKLPMERIQVWFQNRRAKYRRGQVNSASNR